MEHKLEFDVMKGILIVLVVIGHTSIKIPYIDPFWFHMPAFFMITGYLSKKWMGFKDIVYFRRKIFQLLIPYLSYSVLFYLLIGYTPLWKYILKVLLGGTLNITSFSYPFWYINALLVALIVYGFSKQFSRKIQILFVFLLYFIIHLMSFMKFHPPVPWGIDTAMGALVFICLGDNFKSYRFKQWHYIFLLAPVVFVIINKMGVKYEINMASMKYDHFLLDILVPCIFTYALYLICLQLKNWRSCSYILSIIGRSSLTIYFTHAALIYILKPYISQSIIVVF